MLDYIKEQLKARMPSQPVDESEKQMDEAVVEYAHLFQELDDISMDGTEAGSSRPYTKIDIPVADDIEIDSVELNLLDGRVTDIPMDATVQEAQRDLIYSQMRTFDSFYQEAYSSMTQYTRESDQQFHNRVNDAAQKAYTEYQAYIVQEGLFGFDKVSINSKEVPTTVTLNLGKLPGRNTPYYVKLKVYFQVDEKHRILKKQLHSIQLVERHDEIAQGLQQAIFNAFGEKAGIESVDDVWNVATVVEIIVPAEPLDKYHVAFGIEIDGINDTKYIDWLASMNKSEKLSGSTQTMRLADKISHLNILSKREAIQEMAIPKRTPSRFFQEAIDMGNPDEAPASDATAPTVSVDDTPPAEGGDTAPTDAPTDAAPAETPEAGGENQNDTVADTNDVSDQIADKVAEDNNAEENPDVNIDDITTDTPDETSVDDSGIDSELGSDDTSADGEGSSTDEDTSNIDFDNMTIDELLEQGSEKLKGMTIQQLKDFLNAPDGTSPEEVEQEAFFITRGNVGRELDINLRKTLGILNSNDLDIEQIKSEFCKAGKSLNRVAYKASKMDKVFNEEERKRLQKMNHCLSDLIALMRSQIDQQSLPVVKRLIQAFVSEATAVAQIVESKNPKPVQEAAVIKKRGKHNSDEMFKSLSPDRKSLIAKRGLFGDLFKKKTKEEKGSRLPANFPISESELMQIVQAIDDETAKPCIKFDFTKIETGSAKPTDSVLGGVPPYVTEIPEHNGKQYRFLAQINLGELPKMKDIPTKGILQFWYIESIPDSQIVYIENTSKPSIADKLDQQLYDTTKYDIDTWAPFCSTNQYRISFKTETNYLAPYSWDEVDEYFKLFMEKWNQIITDSSKQIKSEKEASNIINMIPEGFNKHFDHKDEYSQWGSKIGGYPGFTQSDFRDSSYTPDNTFLLLQLDSEDQNHDWIMMWGDVGSAQWFIKKDDLKKLNFETAIFDWACY